MSEFWPTAIKVAKDRQRLTVAFNDGNGDGVVTEDEFEAASAKLFPMLDRNGDGVVTADDLGRP